MPTLPKDTLQAGFETYALQMKFFIKKRGYLGPGPCETTVGDRICVFSGSDVPFVRKRSPLQGSEVVGVNLTSKGPFVESSLKPGGMGSLKWGSWLYVEMFSNVGV